jgi:hypothetical protein
MAPAPLFVACGSGKNIPVRVGRGRRRKINVAMLIAASGVATRKFIDKPHWGFGFASFFNAKKPLYIDLKDQNCVSKKLFFPR